MRSGWRISPQAYARVATLTLLALTLIVLTGAAVRLTGSGLGCPDWPKCYGKEFAPLETHAIIEYSNRLFSGLVGFAAVAASGLAFVRRPFRRDLALLGLGALTIFAGTAATAAGPHAGGMSDQTINRLTFKGAGTLDWAIHQHARIALVLGLATAGVWWLLHRRGADPAVRRSLLT